MTRSMESAMRRIAAGLLVAALTLPPAVAAAPTDKPGAHKHVAHRTHRIVHWRGYGFLPGYEPPEVAERRREREYRERHPFWGPAWPRFYHGRWNGGGFGPCWTQTPIGPMWNCGR
jgi:hypothetical protein